jgi:DNA-binding NarL/FixJ family response regulator
MQRLDQRRSAILVDDHPMWLEVMCKLCDDVGIDVLGEALSLETALERLSEHQPELLVVDLALNGGANATSWLKQARERVPSLRILVLSDNDDPESIEDALRGGADAFVSKSSTPDDVGAAVRQIFQPSVFIAFPHSFQSTTVARRRHGSLLTRRETQILELVSKGYSNGQVARMLWVTEQTVKFHLSNVYRKLGVANRTEATRWMFRNSTEDELLTAGGEPG